MYEVTSGAKVAMKVVCFIFALLLIISGGVGVKIAEEEIEEAQPKEVISGVVIDGEYTEIERTMGFANPEKEEYMKSMKMLSQTAVGLGVVMGVVGICIRTKVKCDY